MIPCFQNEGNIPVTCARLLQSESSFEEGVNFEYIMIDDGSRDATLEELRKFKILCPDKVKVIKLRTNVGSYNAIYAGLQLAKGNCIVVMAADLQDPPEHIHTMYGKWKEGAKLVLANRSSRNDRLTANFFASIYLGVIRLLAIPNLPAGGFDFCLFDKKVNVDLLENWKWNTNSLFILLKLPYCHVLTPYEKQVREIGTSSWTFSKKLELFINTILAFSPLSRFAIYVSCLIIPAFVWVLGLNLIVPSILAFGMVALLLFADMRFRKAQTYMPLDIAEVV